MFCPQCGTESPAGQQYCRSCGANLKVIGKAVSLSEAIARSDRGPLPKIKEMMKSLKIEQVSEDISHALDQMNKEIVKTPAQETYKPWWVQFREKKTPESRREKHITKGTISLFSGIAITIFLYYLTGALVLKLPPDWIAKTPFEIEPVVHVFWLVGLLPALSGLGHIVAGLLIRASTAPGLPSTPQSPAEIDPASTQTITQGKTPLHFSGSVTEHTTNILDQSISRPERKETGD